MKRTQAVTKPLRARRAPSSLMTWAKLKKKIKAGHGQGHKEHYKPWIAVTRKTSSPVSSIGLLPAPDLRREHHYLSVGERTTILILKWLGAADIREQFPVWPWPHVHPAAGLTGGSQERMLGLAETAQHIGIRHGVYPGTGIPYVATLDILSTWEDGERLPRLIAHECKPLSVVDDPRKQRVRDRLALTEQYCIAASIRRFVVHAEQLPPCLGPNLDALIPRLTNAQQLRIRQSGIYQHLVDQLNRHHGHRTPTEIVRATNQSFKLSHQTMSTLVHLAIWHQDVDHDLTVPLELHHPLISGGEKVKQSLSRLLLGRSE